MDDCLWSSNLSLVSKINPMLNQSYTPLVMTKCIWAHRWILYSCGTWILQSDKALEVQSIHGKNDKWLSLWRHPVKMCLSSSWESRWERGRMRLTTGGPASRFHFIFNCLYKSSLSKRSKRYYFFSLSFLTISVFQELKYSLSLRSLGLSSIPNFSKNSGRKHLYAR